MNKILFITPIATITSIILELFGEWNNSLITLLIFMIIDYISGIIVATVFKKSTKTKDGGLSSKIHFIGLTKKFIILGVIIIAHRLDIILNLSYVENTVIISYIINELLSIIENLGIMGVPIPTIITKALTLLNGKESEEK